MPDDLLHYDKLVENALKGVVKTALQIVQRHGLPGNHHFYITFRTDMPGVEIPPYLREKYPEEMTIVLQYQFYSLEVDDLGFSVSLSFNNVQETLIVPFVAVTGFADPSVKFGLQFHNEEEDDEDIDPVDILSLATLEPEPEPATLSQDIKNKKNGEQTDNVVRLDSFRDKK